MLEQVGVLAKFRNKNLQKTDQTRNRSTTDRGPPAQIRVKSLLQVHPDWSVPSNLWYRLHPGQRHPD